MLRRVRQRLRSEKPPAKGDAEVEYWRGRRKVEGELSGPHYRRLYTELFGLEASFFADRRVLDVGCGPRGSLEWATGECRVGLDPLAERYAELGITEHGMRYVTAAAEAMPFRNGAFDIVTSLNSLDHVDDLDAAITELARVIGPDGTLLVITETRTWRRQPSRQSLVSTLSTASRSPSRWLTRTPSRSATNWYTPVRSRQCRTTSRTQRFGRES